MPDSVPTETFDFETKGVEGWTVVDGQWAVEEMAGAPSGKKVLVQRATKNQFNVIVATPGPYSDIDVSMKFKPISGREDASGGIVFRFSNDKYYVVRANALEDITIAGAARSRPRASRRRHSAGGIRCAWSPWAITCRRGSTESSISTTAMHTSRLAEWGCGRRPIPSRRSMTWRFAG